MDRGGLAGVHQLSLNSAAAAFDAGKADLAADWLDQVPATMRPARLEGAVHYALARKELSERRWPEARSELTRAVSADPKEGHYQRRLALLRRREGLMSDRGWQAMSAAIDPVERMPSDRFAPEVTDVYACGAYYSRGSGRAAAWTRLFRDSKNPVPDREEGAAILRLTTGYFCRFLAERTPLLAVAEVVVPIPADPDRYLARMGFSLPDALARAVENQLSVPAVLLALQRTTTHVEMKKLSSTSERRTAAALTYTSGPERNVIDGRAVLLVDDLITSGSTLQAAAGVLRRLGATRVVAAALGHTEG